MLPRYKKCPVQFSYLHYLWIWKQSICICR